MCSTVSVNPWTKPMLQSSPVHPGLAFLLPMLHAQVRHRASTVIGNSVAAICMRLARSPYLSTLLTQDEGGFRKPVSTFPSSLLPISLW